MNVQPSSLKIVGMGALSSIGTTVAEHDQYLQGKENAGFFPSLGELLGQDCVFKNQVAAWIKPRTLLSNRKWSPASMAALHVAKQACSEANWSEAERLDCALVLGTSRGNAAGWLGEWPGRRPFRIMAASNTIHSEPASAISIELGIAGVNHVLASGCAAGLDAIGLAMLLVESGHVERALAVAVDLPLVPILLKNYQDSGLLSARSYLDPYSLETDGFIPAEAAAAIAIEKTTSKRAVQLWHYANNNDAADPVGIPKDGGRLVDLIQKAMDRFDVPQAICPHATGTQVQSRADQTVFSRVFSGKKTLPTLHLLKPYLGHSIGASGMIETVILASYLQRGKLPPNLKHLSHFGDFQLPTDSQTCTGKVMKISQGMGGHNSLLMLSSPA